jgi:ADP-heptose:LPS heptosyltransferase
MQKRIHGVLRPVNGRPGNIVNIRSKKVASNNTIRLDRLLQSECPKILIKRRLGGIGDVLMTTPILKKLKKLLPNCLLTYATDLTYSEGALAQIINHNPYVDFLVGNGQVDEKDYDYIVDVTTTGLSKEKAGSTPPNRIDMFAEEVGISVADDPVPDYTVMEHERKIAKEFIKNNTEKKRKKIAIQARSNDSRRTWPLEYVQELANKLSETYSVLLFDWGHSVGRWIGKENLLVIKDISLEETAAIVEQVDLVVCPDSSMLHLAGALNKRIVTIFGPIPAESRINHYVNAVAVQLKLHCSRCWYSPSCNKHGGTKLECLTGIKPDMVIPYIELKLRDPEMSFEVKKGMDRMTGSQANDTILVRRNVGGLGDILMLSPALEALKIKYPQKFIHLAIPSKYIPIMENLPFISRIVDSSIPDPGKYFITADLSNPCAKYESQRLMMKRPVEKSRVEIFAEALGVRNLITRHTPIYNVSEEEKKWAETFLSSQKLDKNKKLVAVNLSSAEKYRDYPKDKQDKLIEELLEKYNVIELGMDRTGENKRTIDACGFPIRKWAAILSLCDGFITVDTGPLHVAAALDIPTVAIFGPIDYKMRCKGYNNVTVLVSDLDCIPCWRNAKIPCKKTGSITEYSKCMHMPSLSIVKQIDQKLLNKK